MEIQQLPLPAKATPGSQRDEQLVRVSPEGHFTHHCPKQSVPQLPSSKSNMPLRWQRAAYGGLDGDRCICEACMAHTAKWAGKRRNKCSHAGWIGFTNLTGIVQASEIRKRIASVVMEGFSRPPWEYYFSPQWQKKEDLKYLRLDLICKLETGWI